MDELDLHGVETVDVVAGPLGAERACTIIRDNVCVSDTRFVLNYYRLTPDHRLLWGGGESYSKRFPRDIAGLVRAKMLEIFPQLADVAFSHVWGGTLAITGTRFPAFQKLDDRTLATVCALSDHQMGASLPARFLL